MSGGKQIERSTANPSRWGYRGIATFVAFALTAGAQEKDVTFFVIGKHANYSQNDSGDRQPVDYSFFSELFLTTGGDAGNASLTFPSGERVNYKDMRKVSGGSQDNIFLYSGPDRFQEFSDLQQRYPDGIYRISFDTPSGVVVAAALKFENRSLPNPPAIKIAQRQDASCTRLAPGVNTVVTWGAFEQGAADENGILDDLVFVILTNAEGVRVAHSGRPFEGKSYLTYADSKFTIGGDILVANQTYTLSVEHAILDDTTRIGGVPAFTTRAVTTKLSVSTGSAGMTSCVVSPSLAESIQESPGVDID